MVRDNFLTKHASTTNNKCEVCGKLFAGKARLERHRLVHTGEKPFECSTCKRRFGSAQKKNLHVSAQHKGERNYVCKICENPFSRNDELVSHMRQHTGEKPYNCDQCGRGFAVKSTLIRHRRTCPPESN